MYPPPGQRPRTPTPPRRPAMQRQVDALEEAVGEIRDAMRQLVVRAAQSPPPRRRDRQERPGHDRPGQDRTDRETPERRPDRPDRHRHHTPERRLAARERSREEDKAARRRPRHPSRHSRSPSTGDERHHNRAGHRDASPGSGLGRTRHRRTPSRDRRRSSHSRGNRRDRMDDMDEEMERYRARYRRLEGRRAIMHDMFVKDPIAKPHMYINRPGCNSLAQKLAARNTMTEREYIAAYMAMLHDEEVYDPRDYRDMVDHLRCITEDTMRKPWATVRDWSQKLFDKIEKKQLRWSDKQGIQNDRFTAHTTLPAEERSAPVSNNEVRGARGRLEAEPHERPCTIFNSIKKCPLPTHHQDGPHDVVHACAHCYKVTQAYYEHSEQQCRRKNRSTTTKNY